MSVFIIGLLFGIQGIMNAENRFMAYKRTFLLLGLYLVCTLASGQDTIPGQFRHNQDGFIEYIPGNMPVVISIPHGGSLLPATIPERPCINCAKHRDTLTIEIGLGLRDIIYERTGFAPYIIINNLHRTRLDPNRNIDEAADGNKNAGLAWHEFQDYIDSANAEVQRNFSKGLYIDLHGHRHKINRIELGYLLSSEELQLDDSTLDDGSFEEFSSIRNLAGNNIGGLTFAELVRGRFSMGSMLEERGYVCVPSPGLPAPGPDEAYFSGGYNTYRHGSSNGGTIDGIQIELDEAVRTDNDSRNKLISDLAEVIIEFMRTHYFPDINGHSGERFH
jgi:hypothetical protein